jgi:glycosyltransferase involved in cell wall biosynthesis
MKIAVISTTILTCPPKGYSGLEQLAYQQAAGLAAKGHQVLLVAPIGSTPPPGVELHGTTLGESEMQAYSGYWQRLPDFDAIIDNSWQKWAYILKIEGKLKTPVLGVCHAPAETMYKVPPPVPKPCMVAISKDQATVATGIWHVPVKTAYNGVDLNFYKILDNVEKSDRYLFLARISHIKGPTIALSVCAKCNVGLDMVGDDKITGEPQLAALVKEAATRSNGRVVYHGGQDRDACVGFFNRGKALLHMNQIFREPFGLAPVEAQACGLPVIAWDNGAMRETVKHGETGFLVKSQEEVETLILSGAIRAIKPTTCREWVSQFSVEKMVDTYEALAIEAIDTGGW